MFGDPEVEEDNHVGEEELQTKHRLVSPPGRVKSPVESQHDGSSSNRSSTLGQEVSQGPHGGDPPDDGQGHRHCRADVGSRHRQEDCAQGDHCQA